MRPKARRSQWRASYVMVCIGCRSVRRSLSSKGTTEQTMRPRSLVRAREKSKPRGQRGAKRKETTEFGELSEELPPKEEVILSSYLEGKVAMKIMKLGTMRLNLSEVLELAE
ncbi:hypothetical protein Gotur_026873 [Gossypium turneri]